jgi:hypothetical protein
VKPAGKLPNANALKACAPVYATVGTIGTNKSGAVMPVEEVSDTPVIAFGATETLMVPVAVVELTPDRETV